MGQILIISNDRDTRTKLNGYLLAHIGHEVILQDSARNAISMMQLIPDVDLIITKDVILKENTAEKLFEFLILHNKDHGTNIPVVVLGDCPKGYPRSSDVPVKASWQVIVSEVASMLNMTPLVPIPAEEPVYYSLNIKYYLFLANMSLNFDSYMKVKNKNKEYEYELIIKADQKFERVNIEKLIKKGVQKLYVPKGSIAAAINLARTQLMKYVKSHHTDEKDRDQLNSDCYDLAADLVRTGEVDDFAYEFININLKAITLATSDVRAYENFLKKRKLLRLSYGYTHFYLTCLIMQEIIKNFKWATPDLKQKIIYLLYFHDISLNDDFIIQVHHSYLAKFHQIKPKERELVLSHALASSVISERFKDLYPDLPNLVREHHGVTAGNNILDTLSLIASPITMTLIVTEDYVTQFLEITEEPTKENYHAIFSFFEKKYTKITYLEAYKAIKKLIEDAEEKVATAKAATLAATKAAQLSLTTAVASMAAGEQVIKAEAEKNMAQAVINVTNNAAEQAATHKATLDKELTMALAAANKLAAEQVQIEKNAAAITAEAEAKLAAAKKSAQQMVSTAKLATDKANVIVSSINSAINKAKADVLKTIAEKTAAEKVAWQAAEQVRSAKEAKSAADKAASEAKDHEAKVAAQRLTSGKVG